MTKLGYEDSLYILAFDHRGYYLNFIHVYRGQPVSSPR